MLCYAACLLGLAVARAHESVESCAADAADCADAGLRIHFMYAVWGKPFWRLTIIPKSANQLEIR